MTHSFPTRRASDLIDPEWPGDATFTLFESGAILIYLAKKHQSPLWPDDPLLQARVLQWLMFQTGGVGPMFGQLHHFRRYAAHESYSLGRYDKEIGRASCRER